RVTGRAWLSLGVLLLTLLTLLGSLRPLISTPSPAIAQTHTVGAARPHPRLHPSMVPPRHFVPRPLQRSLAGTAAWFVDGHRVVIPAHTRLTRTVRQLLFPRASHARTATGNRDARLSPPTLHAGQRHPDRIYLD